MKNADENELRSIASDPDDIHMYNVNDFKFLVDIVDDLSGNLCNSVKGPGRKGLLAELKCCPSCPSLSESRGSTMTRYNNAPSACAFTGESM